MKQVLTVGEARLLHVDPSQYSRDKTIEPFIRRALQ